MTQQVPGGGAAASAAAGKPHELGWVVGPTARPINRPRSAPPQPTMTKPRDVILAGQEPPHRADVSTASASMCGVAYRVPPTRSTESIMAGLPPELYIGRMNPTGV